MSDESQSRPRADLFLLSPGFTDTAFPGKLFFCRHSALVEGVLVSFPETFENLQVHRVGFARPRAEVVALVGEANQSLPVLVLPPGTTSDWAAGESGGRWFVTGADPILEALAELYGSPPAHP